MSANISALSHRLEEASGVAYEYEYLTSAGMYLNGKLLLMLGENQHRGSTIMYNVLDQSNRMNT